MTIGPQYATYPETIPVKPTLKEPTIRLDKLDVHLLRELLQGSSTLPLNPNFAQSYRSIARHLRVHEDTARNRARRLEESGFIVDWGVMLHPNLLGLHQYIVNIEVPKTVSKTELISRLKLVPDVFLMINFYGSLLGVIFAYDTPYVLQNRVNLIQSLAKSMNISCLVIPWTECKMNLSATDWRILHSLQRNPRKSHATIAQEVRVSSRTVERRLRRMVDKQAIFMMAEISPKSLNGTVLASLIVGHSPQDTLAAARKIREELDDYLWHLFFALPGGAERPPQIWASLALPSLAKAREVLEWAETQEGMRNPRIELWEDHIVLLETLAHHLDDKLENLGIN